MLEEEIITLLKWLSGRKSVQPEQLIGRDVGIYGGDAVELIQEIDERFGVNLDPLIKAQTTYASPGWISRLLGRDRGKPNIDFTVRQLVDYVRKELSRRSTSG